MIDCPFCGRAHRTQEVLDKCRARVEAKADREKKKLEDTQRREYNAEEWPVESAIREWFREGTAMVNVVARLNRDYPPPIGKPKWTSFLVGEIRSSWLNWPEGWVDPATVVPPIPHDYHMIPLTAKSGDRAGQVVCRNCIREIWGEDNG